MPSSRLAAVLTLTSWVGYHNSHNRPRHFIRFPNLPLLQFLFDIAMVVVYWLTAVTAERVTVAPDGVQVHDMATAVPESFLVAAALLLYVAWDWVGLAIRRDDRYGERPLERDVPVRRHVTWWFAAGAVGLAAVVATWDPDQQTVVIVVDVVLAGMLVAFRLAKEYFTTEDPYAERPQRNSADDRTVGEQGSVRP